MLCDMASTQKPLGALLCTRCARTWVKIEKIARSARPFKAWTSGGASILWTPCSSSMCCTAWDKNSRAPSVNRVSPLEMRPWLCEAIELKREMKRRMKKDEKMGTSPRKQKSSEGDETHITLRNVSTYRVISLRVEYLPIVAYQVD